MKPKQVCVTGNLPRVLVRVGKGMFMPSSEDDGFNEFSRSYDIDDSLQIVSQDMKAHLCAHPGKGFVRKWVYPIQHLSVPNGCSAVDRRTRIRSGSRSRRASNASTTCSCSHRATRRYLLVVNCFRMAQVGQFDDQYL